jgi:hypothetical protein
MKKQRNTYEYQTMRALKRKLYLIELRGGKCEICGYDKNLSAFDFHHIDKNTKESQLDQSKLSNSSMKYIMNEFSKCQVLCANCHRETHSPDLSLNKVREKISKYDLERSEKWINLAEPKKYNCIDCGCEISKWGKRCKTCHQINNRKVDRPDIDVIIEKVKEEGYRAVGREYGVSDNAVRKWIKQALLSALAHNELKQ